MVIRLKDVKLCEELHPYLNKNIFIDKLSTGSSKKVWWLGECGHTWEMAVRNRFLLNRGCPYCSNQKVLAGFNDLATSHPALIKQWHSTLNGNLTPFMVTGGSSRKVWWLGECEHEWKSSIWQMTRGKGTCPYCSNQKVLAGFNDLATVNPVVAAQWHPIKNGKLTPAGMIVGSDQKVWWKCSLGHEWEASGYGRSKGSGCPYCSNQKVLAGFNDLATVNPVLASQWHPTLNGNLTPAMVNVSSSSRVWWKCEKGHEWEAAGYSRSNGNDCPKCSNRVSKPEIKLFEYISGLNVGKVNQSVRSLITPYEVDIFVPNKNIAIEFNGLYWHGEDKGKDKFYHYNKWKACRGQGVQLVQVWEDDWNRNPELIESMLAHKLGVSREKRIFARNTEIRSLSKQKAETFLTANHLQGFRASTAYYGLFDKELGLVTLLSVIVKGKKVEISRFASSVVVIGGFSKLLKYVIKSYDSATVVHSYSHNDYATGNVYEKTGFVKVHDGKPGYSYIVHNERVNRLNFTKQKFKTNPDLLFEEGLTERKLAELNGLVRVWDSGSSLWVKELTNIS